MRVLRTRLYKFIYNIAWQLTFPTAADLWASASWQSARGGDRIGTRSIDQYLNRPKFELYGLANDPGELTNLADNPAHAALVEDFSERLKGYQKAPDDPCLHRWVYE